ncbi:helix-turn-helix domain-containing protein [Phenylobacterium terrae]|uniref:Helix-turn-helix domain-containing protein n=1 Tax=Phenylobacterium terrae TaxID=2665495 RepID=A0ABW4N6B2_9CAUL
MVPSPDLVSVETAEARISHGRLPPWRDETVTSVSNPGSIGLAFAAQRATLVRVGDASPIPRDVPPNSIGLGGAEPIAWLAVDAPSEQIEITASPALRREIAEGLGVAAHADLADLHGWEDPVILAIALRLRAGVRRWRPLDRLAQEELIRAAYARVLQRRFGGRPGTPGSLDARRLARVTDYVRAHPDRSLTITELAAAAHLSPFHFARSFRRSVGLAPHQFVAGLRLEVAVARLRSGDVTVAQAAHEAGFSNLSHFRRQVRLNFGDSPTALRA